MKRKKEEPKCICDQCPRRFICFTQKKVFSDPAYQAMYEAHIEEGLEHEEAVKAVREFIEMQKAMEARRNQPEPNPRIWDDDYIDKKKHPFHKKWVKWTTPPDDSNKPEFDKFRVLYGDIKSMTVGEAEKAIEEVKNLVRKGEIKNWMRSDGKSTKSEMR